LLPVVGWQRSGQAPVNQQIRQSNRREDDRVSSQARLSLRPDARWLLDSLFKKGLLYFLYIIMETINGKIRVHAGYHKCLTKFTKQVYNGLCKHRFRKRRLSSVKRFRHFFHRLDHFYDQCQQFDICSISGNYIDLDRFEDIRVVRVIRDPRDLIISAYYYHKRAAEPWTKLANPTDEDWKLVRGAVPANLPTNTSLTKYLNEVSLEEGLHAEIEFRKYHYQSMLEWPENDPRVILLRYEDIIGNEVRTFWKILSFFGFSLPTRVIGSRLAKRFSSKSKHAVVQHIRNPNSGQWREHFTPGLTKRFNELYGDVLNRYGYSLD
jgi:hypothetical protein